MRRWTFPASVGALAALMAWVLLVVGAHLLQDHADHHLVLELLKYNIQQGRLAPLPLGSVGALPAPPTGGQLGQPPTPPAKKP